MADDDPQYPPPETPLSFREVLSKALAEPQYAEFIHNEVDRLRNATTEQERAEVLNNIDAHFMLSDVELMYLELPPGFGRGTCCTDTKPTLPLLEFATKTPGWHPPEPSP